MYPGCSRGRTKYAGFVHEFAVNTSLPGVPRVILAHSCIARCFWIVVCLLCTTVFVVGVSDLLRSYFSYPKKVKTYRTPRSIKG